MEEVRRLRELAEAGISLESIATILGRTPSAIKNKALLHAVSLRRAPRERRVQMRAVATVATID